MIFKKYKPCKSKEDLEKRYTDFLNAARKKGHSFPAFVPVEIFGLDMKGKSGEFELEDLQCLL